MMQANKKMLERGLVQLYTGNGKGKTTAALGLALRAAGAGLRTMIVQFMKGQHYGELDAVKKLGDLILIEQFGSPRFCMPDGKNFEEHYRFARKALERSRTALADHSREILVLDEIVTAFLFKLVTVDEIKDIIRSKPAAKELVLTGRGAPQELVEMCDLVTEMNELKHYYQAGVKAREGIEF